MEARPGDVMAGAGRAAGPAPDVHLQVEQYTYTIIVNHIASTLLAQWFMRLDTVREVLRSIPVLVNFCLSRHVQRNMILYI